MFFALFAPSCIPPPSGYRWYYVRKNDTLWSVAKKNKVDAVNLINANDIKNSSLIYPGMRLKIPYDAVLSAPKKATEKSKKDARGVKKKPPQKKPSFGWPAKGKIVRNFGKSDLHRWQGIVIKTNDRNVRVAERGKVSFCGDVYPFGKTIIIKHSAGYHTVYGYLENYAVKTGDAVAAKSIIGNAGSEKTFGAGVLYFEIRYMTDAYDPLLYLD